MADRRSGSPAWGDDDELVARESEPERPGREKAAKVFAVTLTWLSVIPAAILTLLFYVVRLPPLDRDDYPDLATPNSWVWSPMLLLFLLPPVVTGLAAHSIGGEDAPHGFWHYSGICLLVMAPFIVLSALSMLG